MDKVIVERPRAGRSWVRTGRGKKKLDPELLQIGMKKAVKIKGHYKVLNENLSPLRRYLEAQAGRPWDKVWSEISANLKPSSTVQQHVRDHVPDFVASKTKLIDGEIWYVGRRSGLVRLKSSRVRLYVHPVSGLLLKNRHSTGGIAERRAQKAAEAAERNRRMRIVDPGLQYHLLDDGAWWEVRLAPIPTVPVKHASRHGDYTFDAPVPVIDAVTSAHLSRMPPEELYARKGLYATAKRQLSRREAKALGLR
jgi:hypothetical protein